MKIIRGIENLAAPFSGCVLTMGNFDGLHLGHQALLAQLAAAAKRQQLPTAVMIFEPQPLEYFAGDNAPGRLMSFQEKCQEFTHYGIDYLICIPFSQRIATLPACEFIEQWLINRLHAHEIIVGDDFAFGAERQGTISLLNAYAEQGAFHFVSLPTFEHQGLRVSSTAVRHALAAADFKLAQQLLGRAYTITGKVVHGNALARQLGFPTANVHLQRRKPALSGVYVVSVTNQTTQQRYHGIANIGIRPTVKGEKATLEVNIFDFDQAIYGHCLSVTFRQKIRDEQKFASLDALKQQIAQDVCIARKISAKF